MPKSELVVVHPYVNGISQPIKITIRRPEFQMPLAYSNTAKTMDAALEGVEERVLKKSGHLPNDRIGKEIASDVVDNLKASPGGIMVLHSLASGIPVPMHLGMKLRCAREFPKEYCVGEAIEKAATKSILELEPSFKGYKRTR